LHDIKSAQYQISNNNNKIIIITVQTPDNIYQLDLIEAKAFAWVNIKRITVLFFFAYSTAYGKYSTFGQTFLNR